MQRLQVSYEGTSSSVPEARHAVQATLTSWGMEELGWTAALLVSELAANVALHARTAFTVTLEVLPGGAGVRLGVTDGSPRVPRQRHFGDDATTGRGMHLVAELSRDWGVERSAAGKTVWVELAAGPDATGTPDTDEDDDLDALLLSFPDLEDGAGGARALAA